MSTRYYAPFLLTILYASSAAAQQTLLNTNVSFNTVDQSMWSSDGAFLFDYTQFVGIDTNPAPVVFGSGASDTVSFSVPFVGTYSANPYLQFDTDFKVGMELGASISSGTIDANIDFGVNFATPDVIRVGESFSLLGTSSKLATSSFSTSPATASAYIDGIVEAYFGAYARVEYVRPGILADSDYRLGNKGFTENNTSNVPYSTLVNIVERKEIIGINRNASGVVRYLGGQDLTDGDLFYDELGAGSSVSLGPISATAGNFNVFTNGALSGGSVTGTGSETLVTVTLDIDQLIVGSAALGQSIAHDWGPIDYDLGYDVVDVNASLDIDLEQNFQVDAELMVQLVFSEDVLLDGIGTTNIFVGALSSIPNITIFADAVDVTPTFFVDATLFNDTGLSFLGSLNTTILEAHANIGWDIVGNTGSRGYNIGPVYQSTVPVDLGSISVFNDTFALGGFGMIDGTAFTISAVPVPAAVWLFGSALGLLGWIRRKTV